MKKIFLIAMVGVCMSANAQLTVLESGQTQIGDVSGLIKGDQYASLNIWKIPNPKSNPLVTDESSLPYITFGAGRSASIAGDSGVGALSFFASSSLIYRTDFAKVPVFTYKSNMNTFAFSCDVKAQSFLTASDARLKRNVSSLNESYKGLMDVTPVSYNLIKESEPVSSEVAVKVSNDDVGTNDNRECFGFIAQEVQEIFPNLVVADEDGMLSIDYTGFIPLLVEAYKELSKKVEAQEETIAQLSNGHSPLYIPASVGTQVKESTYLKQNTPNPFSNSTLIECMVPKDVVSACIYIYDLQGKPITRLEISDRGNTSITLDAASMQPGMYIYALVADGVELESKRMILTE